MMREEREVGRRKFRWLSDNNITLLSILVASSTDSRDVCELRIHTVHAQTVHDNVERYESVAYTKSIWHDFLPSADSHNPLYFRPAPYVVSLSQITGYEKNHLTKRLQGQPTTNPPLIISHVYSPKWNLRYGSPKVCPIRQDRRLRVWEEACLAGHVHSILEHGACAGRLAATRYGYGTVLYSVHSSQKKNQDNERKERFRRREQ